MIKVEKIKTFMSEFHPKILVTDLDGTLIPIDSDPEQCSDLLELKNCLGTHQTPLVFATGRHYESVLCAIKEFQLPNPQFMIADVGTSIFTNEAGRFLPIEQYANYLCRIVGNMDTGKLSSCLEDIGGIQIQESDKQGPFKLSYYADATNLENLVSEIEDRLREIDAPYRTIDSVDPFNGDGLIDLLPKDTSKSAAITWLSNFNGWPIENIVYAGDSRNDLAAMQAGYNTIIVGNACDLLRQDVIRYHNERGWVNRVFIANKPASSGVLQGCKRFGLLNKA